MKARTIKRLRNLISKEGYYDKRIKRISDLLEYWNNFRDFECDSFFVGYEKAEYNLRRYTDNALRLNSKYKWYCKKAVDDKKIFYTNKRLW